MKLNDDMLFAHPVLSSTSTDYRDALFDSSFTVTIGGDENLDISATLTLRCPDLNQLLESGAAGCGFYLVCRPAYDNRLIEMAPGNKDHRFRAGDFFGTINLRPVVWSKQERRGWKSKYLHPEYGGSVDFPVASILAVGADQPFSVDRERLKPFESIFKLAALEGLDPGQIAVDTDDDKIIINAHPQTKEIIDDIRNNQTGRIVLLNAVYLPAVMQVLNEVATGPDRFEQWAWFRIFSAKCASAGVDLSKPDALRDAQRLLVFPFTRVEAEKERLFT